MKNVLFIIPPSNFLIDQKVFPNLGLLRLATYIKKTNNVTVLDLSGDLDYINTTKSWLKDKKIDYIGFTATTPQIPEVFNLASNLKEYTLILGGPHATMTVIANSKTNNNRSINALKDLTDMFDHVIAGDGELVLEQLLLGNITDKVINVENSEYFITNDIYEDLPITNRELIDINSYNYTIDSKKSTSLIWQQGCPFGCGFCGGRLTKSYRSTRHCSVEKMMREIDILYKKYNYTGFMLYDDELNLHRDNFIRYLDSMIQYQKSNNVEFNLRGFVRADMFDDDIAQYMYKAGFRWVLCGFESGSNKMLENMMKKNTVESNTRCVEIAKRNDLKVKALMSIGHPGESRETIQETKSWLATIKPDEFDVTIISVYSGTPYYDYSIHVNDNIYKYTSKSGDNLYSIEIDYKKDSLFYKSKADTYQSFVYTDYLSREDIVNERYKLEQCLKVGDK